MVEKVDSLVMDVETAFLYGDIEAEIFMKSPIGMEEIDPGSSPEDCYQLKKESMDCAKQLDSFGRSSWTQSNKNLLDFK